MSFSSDTKNELAHLTVERPCCARAELAGFARVCGSARLARGGEAGAGLALVTENSAAARRYKQLLKERFGVNANLTVGRMKLRRKGHLYELSIDSDADAGRVLTEAGMRLADADAGGFVARAEAGILGAKCCRKAFLRGAFLGAGTLNDPERGYSFEIVCADERLAADVARVFNGFTDIRARTVRRRNRFVVYLKEAEQIGDMLNILGAHGQLLKFQDVRIVKELRNRTNRISNCDNANLDKALRAAERQAEAIRKIRDGRGWETLPDKLRRLATLRLEHPDASLGELGDLSDPPMKKANVCRQLMKLVRAAEEDGFTGATRSPRSERRTRRADDPEPPSEG